MGSSSSRHVVASSSSSSSYSSSSSSIGRRSRSMGTRVFQSSCLGGRSSGSFETDSDDQVSNNRNKEIGSLSNEPECTDQTSSGSVQMKREFCRKVKLQQQQQSTEVPCVSSDGELEEWGQESVTHGATRPDISSSHVASSRSLIASSRPRSRFSCIPGNISFRLSRAASLGSSRTCSLFSSGLTVSNGEEDVRVHTISTSSSINRNGAHQGSNLLPVCGSTRLPAPHLEETSSSDVLCLEPPLSGVPVHLHDDEIISAPDMARLNENTGFPTDTDDHSSRNPTEIENAETRRLDRRIRAREPVERSVRFSRTLSVGRLRDRVLRRSSFSDALFGRLQEDREIRDSSQDNGGQVWGDITRSLDSNGNAESTQVSSSFPPSGGDLNSLFNNHDYDVETSRSREARYHDMMERRTDFLERRRRIRSQANIGQSKPYDPSVFLDGPEIQHRFTKKSIAYLRASDQVRALQRLGSRFENLSGHERSCILSGQHRTGRCTCRTNNRTTNPDDDTSARASISRIVMLAEALFEVLDEIHQQSVVLSSRPSVSSIGSVPAPKEVVEAMPVKIHTKSQKHQNDDAAQCYICLVEYEEGDCIRILPCHHEFHQTCIDKWLKEIHRVCPLCRGDVCRSDSFAAEN